MRSKTSSQSKVMPKMRTRSRTISLSLNCANISRTLDPNSLRSTKMSTISWKSSCSGRILSCMGWRQRQLTLSFRLWIIISFWSLNRNWSRNACKSYLGLIRKANRYSKVIRSPGKSTKQTSRRMWVTSRPTSTKWRKSTPNWSTTPKPTTCSNNTLTVSMTSSTTLRKRINCCVISQGKSSNASS